MFISNHLFVLIIEFRKIQMKEEKKTRIFLTFNTFRNNKEKENERTKK